LGSLDITPGTWQLLNRLLDQALGVPAPEREAWLARLPPEHAVHVDRLRALLAVENTASPLDAPPGDEQPPPCPVSPPTEVGPYHLLQPLGEGGMGMVWLAERRDLMVRRPVALKLPRVSWQGRAAAQRLAREREILASLSHPNIARLLDAGITGDGHPYLALEYVEGKPIDVHAREQALSIRARLELFRQVLAAVGHAHGRLVVHRDLKPTNVLVTKDGQVRLLDFGIAKLIAGTDVAEPELTQLAGAAFTPNYASPEQLAGEAIGVASDLYSLGVLLYELLAESPPYVLRRTADSSLHASLRSLTIARPSERAATPQLRKALAGDLDTIVQKAMKLSPEERYPTANAFADDVGRFLDGYPIAARPDSAAYRIRKLVARHRAAAAATVAVAIAVVGGASAALWQARRATEEQHRAEEVTDYLTGMFREASPYGAPGRSLSAVDLLKRAHAGLDRVGGRPALRVELLNLLGSTLLDLGDTETGERMALQALQEAESLPPDHVQRLRARLLHTDVLFARARGPELRAELEALIPRLEAQAQSQPADLVRALENRARLALMEVKPADGLRDAQRAFYLAQARLGDQDGRTVDSAVLLAEAYQYGPRDAKASLREAERGLSFALAAYIGQPNHPHVIYARDVFGRALCFAGQPERAVQESSRALQDAREVLGPSSPLVGMMLINRVPCERRLGDLRQAIEDGTRGIELRNAAMQKDSRSWGNSHYALGVTLLAARRPSEALEDLTAAVESLARALGERHWLTLGARAHRMVALAYVGRSADALAELAALQAIRTELADSTLFDALTGTVHRLAGRPAQARQAYEQALTRLPDDAQRRFNRMWILGELGLVEVELGQLKEAEAALSEALTISIADQRVDSPVRAEAWVGGARILLAQRRPAEALPLLERADAFWRDFDADSAWGAEAASWLARCYQQLGRDADAQQAERRRSSLRGAPATHGLSTKADSAPTAP
jgi:eukaryotic-like serine/threonine-protein kinase